MDFGQILRKFAGHILPDTWLRFAPSSAHNPDMTLKNATCFAIVGTAAWTVLTAIDFLRNVSGVMRGFIPAMRLVTSFIPLVAALSLLVFFVAFRRSKSF
jgi:hypothetical protein